MCFRCCDSFPTLCDLIDNHRDEDARNLTHDETEAIVSDCFQYEVCEVQCPYTPADGSDFQCDFPKLVHRFKVQQTNANRVPFADRIIMDPNGTAAKARLSFGLANTVNRVSGHRWFMEKVLGIHREKRLPDFAQTTFKRWAEKTGHLADEPGHEAMLFQAYYVPNTEP